MSVVDTEASKEVLLLSGGWSSQDEAKSCRTQLVELADGLVLDSWITKSSVILFKLPGESARQRFKMALRKYLTVHHPQCWCKDGRDEETHKAYLKAQALCTM
eukprot:6483622-Amphidinium_carterae.1